MFHSLKISPHWLLGRQFAVVIAYSAINWGKRLLVSFNQSLKSMCVVSMNVCLCLVDLWAYLLVMAVFLCLFIEFLWTLYHRFVFFVVVEDKRCFMRFSWIHWLEHFNRFVFNWIATWVAYTTKKKFVCFCHLLSPFFFELHFFFISVVLCKVFFYYWKTVIIIAFVST